MRNPTQIKLISLPLVQCNHGTSQVGLVAAHASIAGTEPLAPCERVAPGKLSGGGPLRCAPDGRSQFRGSVVHPPVRRYRGPGGACLREVWTTGHLRNLCRRHWYAMVRAGENSCRLPVHLQGRHAASSSARSGRIFRHEDGQRTFLQGLLMGLGNAAHGTRSPTGKVGADFLTNWASRQVANGDKSPHVAWLAEASRRTITRQIQAAREGRESERDNCGHNNKNTIDDICSCAESAQGRAKHRSVSMVLDLGWAEFSFQNRKFPATNGRF